MKVYDKLNLTMLCDFYELTMSNGYFESGMKDKIVYFDVFYRSNPDKGGYAIAAGLEQMQALTFASQNLGAGEIKRVRRSVWVCIATVAIIGLVFGNLMLLAGRPLLSLYLDDPQAIDPLTGVTVLDYGMKRLSWMLPLYCLCGLMDVVVGSLRGIGYSIMPMIVSLTGACLFRVVWIMTVFAMNPTLDVLYASYPISWALTFGVHLLCYLFIARKKLGALEARIGQNT